MDLDAIRRAHRAGDGRPASAFGAVTSRSNYSPAPTRPPTKSPPYRLAGWIAAACVAVGFGLWMAGSLTSPGSTNAGATTACTNALATATATETAPNGVDSTGRTITYASANLLDGDLATAWRTPGTGTGEAIVLRFEHRCRLSAIQIVDGYDKIDSRDNTDRWVQNRRVTRFTVTTDRQTEASLDPNERGWQAIRLVPSDVDFVKLVIRGSAPRRADRDFTAVSEISVS